MSNNTRKEYSWNSDKTAVILQVIEISNEETINVDFDVCDQKGRKIGSKVLTWQEKVIETKILSIEEMKMEFKYIPSAAPQPELLFCSQSQSTREGKNFGSTSFFPQSFSSEAERTKHVSKSILAAKKRAEKKAG